MKFDLITFDCYGTLIDWETGIRNAFSSVAKAKHKAIDLDDVLRLYAEEEAKAETSYRLYREVLRETAINVASKIGLALEPSETYFLAESLPSWRPFGDTNPALERLAKRHRLGILSNIDDDLISETIKHFTVPLDVVITAQQVRSYKPHPGHLLELRRRFGQMNWLHAAQSYGHDVSPALELGVPVVWVNRKGQTLSEDKPKPLAEVRNLLELADWLGA